MYYVLLMLAGIVLLCMLQYLILREEFIEIVILKSVVYFFIFYIVTSSILFLLDYFYLSYAVLATVLIIGCIFVVVYKKEKGFQEIRITTNLLHAWPVYLAVLLLCVVFAGHFDFFGMGQDQGVYQIKAINLLYGETSKIQTIDEYDALPEGEYKEYYLDRVVGLGGYDRLVNSGYITGVDVDEETSQTDAYWHGIPTYPAILALSAAIFGIEGMMNVQWLFYVCLLLMVYYILERTKTSRLFQTALVVLLGISPIVVWIKESTLTEGFLAVLIAFYLYMILSENRMQRVGAAIPVIAFSFFHVTVFTMLPVFILIYWLLYYQYKDKACLKAAIAVVIGYFAGFLTMWFLQPRYTLLNYQHGLPFIPKTGLKWIMLLALAASCAAIVVTFLLGKIKEKQLVKEGVGLRGFGRWATLAIVAPLCFIMAKKGLTGESFVYVTLFCYTILTGITLMPIIIYRLVRNKYEYSRPVGVLILFFVWSILIYSLVMRREIQYYYYYARYLMPYLSVVLVLFAYIIDRKKAKIFSAAAVLGILCLLPASNLIREKKDDSMIQWSGITDVLNRVEDYATVFIDPDLMSLYYFPCKAAGAQVYPVMEDVDTTKALLGMENEEIVYLTDDVDDEVSSSRILYRKEFYHSEDEVNETGVLGFPKDFRGCWAFYVTLCLQ